MACGGISGGPARPAPAQQSSQLEGVNFTAYKPQRLVIEPLERGQRSERMWSTGTLAGRDTFVSYNPNVNPPIVRAALDGIQRDGKLVPAQSGVLSDAQCNQLASVFEEQARKSKVFAAHVRAG